MLINGREYDLSNHTYVWGILNVTPDSFSDGGSYTNIDQALRQVEKMVNEGADVIDIGGESTRPGAEKVSAEEELIRVIPAIEAIKRNFDIPISLDTYKSSVMQEGIKAGVCIANDITGLKGDPDMASVVAKAEIPVCIMHIGPIDNIDADLAECVQIANRAGIRDENIILDPGVGFGKDTEQNLKVLADLKRYKLLGYPVLLGCSRKSVIGNTLGLPVDERLNGTLVTTVMAVEAGIEFVRVHDVRANVEAIKMAEAILMCR